MPSTTLINHKLDRWFWYRDTLAAIPGLPCAIEDEIPDETKLIFLEANERKLPGWNEAEALKALGIIKKPYSMRGSAVHGYSDKTTLAITRATRYPTAVVWHELAHIMCRHLDRFGEAYSDDADIRAQAECEAELAAYLLCEWFRYPEAKSKSRAYIMTWAKRSPDILKSLDYQAIYEAVDAIIEATGTVLA